MNPSTDLPQILIGLLGGTTGMCLLGFEILGWILLGKIAKNVIYDQARVNGGSTHGATLGSQDSREIKQPRRKLNCLFKSEILNYKEVLFWLVEIQCVVLSFE